MSRSMAASRRTFRCLAVLAWLALFAQAVGIPIHLAADEHYHDGHHGDHVHFGALGHDEHHAARHRDDGGDHGSRTPGGCNDESDVPPHSARDHLIDTVAPRHAARVVLPAIDAIAVATTTQPQPRCTITLAVVADAPPPAKPPPRRPEQSRAPPALLV